jgi:hypothetical protein
VTKSWYFDTTIATRNRAATESPSNERMMMGASPQTKRRRAKLYPWGPPGGRGGEGEGGERRADNVGLYVGGIHRAKWAEMLINLVAAA